MKLLSRTLVVLVLAAVGLVRGVEIQDFIQETQRVKQGTDGVSLVWWIPTEYWEESLRQNPNVTAKQREEIVAVLAPYSMFAITRMKISALATTKSPPRSEMLDALEIKFGGKSLDPAQDWQLSPEIKNLMLVLKPLMGSLLGQLGQGLEFVIYPNTKDGKLLIDPKSPGVMEAKFYENVFRWRLPLGCLLPPKFDPKTGESFPGNYSFSPYSGEKLSPKG